MRVGVTEIGGERGHVPTDIVGSLTTGLERSYREAMTEIVEPGTAFSLWSSQAHFPSQLHEALRYGRPVCRIPGGDHEEMRISTADLPAQHEIAPQSTSLPG